MSVFVAAVGAVAGFASGTLGVGGAVILLPLLIYLPAVLNLPSLSVHAATGLSALAAAVGALTAGLSHRRAGAVSDRFVLSVGVPMLFGGLIGGGFSGAVSAHFLLVVFALMATLAVGLLVAPMPDARAVGSTPPGLSAILGLTVGFVAGLVGVGGAFLLVPGSMRFLHVPLRIAIASTPLIALAGLSGTLVGKLTTGQVPLDLAPWVVGGSALGALVGASAGRRAPVTWLRSALIAVTAVVALRTWLDVLGALPGV